MIIVKGHKLKKHYPLRRVGLRRVPSGCVHALDGVSFEIEAGTTFGLVGESGCGKTTMAKLILGIEEPSEGYLEYTFSGSRPIRWHELRNYRSCFHAVFQDPYASLKKVTLAKRLLIK